MSKHRDKPTITPKRIEWFARYVHEYCSWGVFHVSLADSNYELGSADFDPNTDKVRAEWSAELLDAADWFDMLTTSQRRRLKQKAEDKEAELWPRPVYTFRRGATMTVTAIDVDAGTITIGPKP